MKRKLGDICKIVSGTTPKTGCPEYWDGDIKWITPAEIHDDTYIVTDTERKITELGVRKTGLSPFPAGTVILSSRAPIGKVAIAGCEMYCNQGFKNLICSEKIHNKYLYWFLKGKKEFLNTLGRGATFKEISKAIVEQIEIELPDFAQQIRIAAIFESLRSLLLFRRPQLSALDELVKARFVEMFGDPVTNDAGWEQALLIDLTSKIGSGATPKGGKESYRMDGVALIRSMNVHDGRFEYKDLAHLSEQQALQLDNVTIEENDVLINITGASVARSCIVPGDVLPARVNQHVAIIRCAKEIIHPVFMNRLLLDHRYKSLLLSIGEAGGATRQAITKQQLENLKVIVPPVPLQKRFAAFASRVESAKASVERALGETQTLFDSLMQEYFGKEA